MIVQRDKDIVNQARYSKDPHAHLVNKEPQQNHERGIGMGYTMPVH